MIYASFVVAGLFTLVRYEGLLILIPMTVGFFYRFRFSKITIARYALVIGLILLIILPMAYVRIETLGYDGLLSNIVAGPKYVENMVSGDDVLWDNLEMSQASGIEKTFYFIQNGVQNLARYLTISLIPTFSFLAPIGIFFLCRKLDYAKLTLIITLIAFLIPAFYAYSRDFQETRYLLVLIPILSVVSIFGIQKITELTKKHKIILVTIFLLILFSSCIYQDNRKIDYNYERNAFDFAKIVYEKASIINGYSPEDRYLRPVIAEFSEDFPKEKKSNDSGLS